jgi:hypothetical protein
MLETTAAWPISSRKGVSLVLPYKLWSRREKALTQGGRRAVLANWITISRCLLRRLAHDSMTIPLIVVARTTLIDGLRSIGPSSPDSWSARHGCAWDILSESMKADRLIRCQAGIPATLTSPDVRDRDSFESSGR